MIKQLSEGIRTTIFLIILGGVFFIPLLGGVHLFDWDEVNFAEISREMLLLEDYLRIYVNFQPFWEKPPLYFWMQVSAMHLFGVGEFAARFPNAIVGIANLVMVYWIGRQVYNHRLGYIWALVYFGTILPFLYAKSGIIDPVFNFFIFLGVYLFILFNWKRNNFEGITLKKSAWWYLFLSGFFVGVAILAKGQVAYLIVSLTFFVYWVYQRFRFYVNVPEFLFFTFATALVTLAWYGLETMQHGTWFIEEFTKYQYRLFSTPDAGHKGFPGYHFVVLLVGCFPASIFALRNFAKLDSGDIAYQVDFRRWMKFLFWVVLILFSIVKSKIVHYSSMAYFPLTFLAAEVIYKIVEGKVSFSKWMKILLGVIGGLFITATIALPFLAQHLDWLATWFDDPFARANLEADVTWTYWAVIPGLWLIIVLALVYVFANSRKNLEWVTTLFVGTATFVMLTLIFDINRIEGYSQNAALSFFESKANEKCYIITHGYKSYAHLFYARKPIVTDERSYDKNFLLNGEVDRPVYVVTKVHKTKELENHDSLQELYRKNGFVFYKRINKRE